MTRTLQRATLIFLYDTHQLPCSTLAYSKYAYYYDNMGKKGLKKRHRTCWPKSSILCICEAHR